ncbi:hypothetical protein C8F01DRAFT_1339488 [Mycena amicta]|nr:hypothetical protein C8F01DRAFT_1339488 [Mycena amicta]
MDPAAFLLSQLADNSLTMDSNSSVSSNASGFASLEDPPYDGSLDPHQLYTGSSVPLFTFCQLAKRQFGLEGQAAVSMENFCQPISTDERLGLVFGAVLQLIAMKQDDTAHEAESYALPENLKSLIKVYTSAYLMCPQASACRGIDASAHIANAMRESYTGIGVPSADDAARMPVVLQYISKKLTSYRNVIKNKIDESDKDGWDVGRLAHTLVGKGVNASKATLQVYIRAAFWRWVYINYPDLDGNKFWIKVDSVLASFRAKSAVECAGALNHLYDMDKQKYGDPATNTVFSAADPATRPGWQVTLARHAALVVVQLETTKNPRKRARTMEPAEQDDFGASMAD